MNTLDQRRLDAAIASKGISTDCIKVLALNLCKKVKTGRLLDFGAGTGELLMQIHKNDTYDTLAGVDIFPRPENLPKDIKWHQQDLNREFDIGEKFDVVVSTEVIEHLENPRATMRNICRLLVPDGYVILTTPNQNSLRSLLALTFGGHFAAFLGASYPAHITALTRIDLERICLESGFHQVVFHYTNSGGIPKMPHIKWQKISFGLLKGKLFSDNIALVAKKVFVEQDGADIGANAP